MVYELMNIRQAIERSTELEAVCASASAESVPERVEFARLTREKGLKAALEWRSSRFAEEDAWWKNQQERP